MLNVNSTSCNIILMSSILTFCIVRKKKTYLLKSSESRLSRLPMLSSSFDKPSWMVNPSKTLNFTFPSSPNEQLFTSSSSSPSLNRSKSSRQTATTGLHLKISKLGGLDLSRSCLENFNQFQLFNTLYNIAFNVITENVIIKIL